ncbi:metallophosphoesterase, partial [Mesotoga sp. HF07.pep.5.2.highcov]
MVEKVLVLSDTHGALSPLTRILQEVDQNTLIMHSGDFLY